MPQKLPRIIYAEDDVDDRQFFSQCLFECNPNVLLTEVYDGVQLMRVLASMTTEELKQCALVSDMKMPRMDALDVLAATSRMDAMAEVPTIILSTSSNPEDIRACLELGATAFFTKPSNLKEMHKIISEILKISFKMEVDHTGC